MKSLLIKNATLISKNHPQNGTVTDIRIDENGIITELQGGLSKKENEEVWEWDNLHVSEGWIDLQAHFCDPGDEHQETIETGKKAARHGGFTRVSLSPLTTPVCDEKSRLKYLMSHQGELPELLFKSTISQKAEGKTLTELYDLHLSGATAFYDGKKEISESLLVKALQYTKHLDTPVFVHPLTQFFQDNGQVHEGKNALMTGLKTIPSLSEKLMTEKAVSILRYTGGKLHLHGISTPEAIQIIAKAKAEGLNITADVFAHQIAFDDSVILDFDSNYKVIPPFRSADDVSALLAGIKEGVIDAICSDHTPVDPEGKELEFDYATPGIAGIQTAFAVMHTQLKNHMKLEDIITLLTKGVEKVLSLGNNQIEVGQKANLTLFNPTLEWEYELANHHSFSRNTPFFNEKFEGKPLAIIHHGQAEVL